MESKLPDNRYEKKYWKLGMENIAGVDEVGKGCFAGPLVTGCVIFPKFAGPAGSSSRSTILGLGKPAGAQRDSLRSRHPLLDAEGVARKRGAPKPGLPFVGGFGAVAGQDPKAAFTMPRDIIINDSKKMRPRQREKSAVWIKENALSWGIGEVSAQKINSIGMSRAAKIAFRKAISAARKRLGKPIDFLLADAFFISYVPGLPARRRKDKKGRFYKKISGRQQAIINGDEKSVSIAAASIIAKVYRDKLMQKFSARPKYRKYGWGRNKGYGTSEHRTAIKKYGTTRQHRKQFVNTWLSKQV